MLPLAAHRRRRIALTLGLLAASCVTATARAETPPSDDIAGAARAFGEGQRAQLRRDYAHAAELFELADRLAPSPPALRSAIRNYEAAGNPAQAMTLATRAAERYPSDVETKKLTDSVLARLASGVAHLVARCTPACTLVVDGRVASAGELQKHHLYLPSGRRAVVASYADGSSTTRVLQMSVGVTEDLALFPTTSPPPPETQAVALGVPVRARPDRRLPPIAAVAGAGITVVLSAVLIWSGTATLAARDRYVSDATEAGFRDGLSQEARTNGLIAGVAVAGAATLALAIFGTNWRGGFFGARRSSSHALRLSPRADFGAGYASAGLAAAF